MTEAKQDFRGPIEGDVAGQDIINEAPGTMIHTGPITGHNNIIGHQGDIFFQIPVRPKVRVVIQGGPEHLDDAQKARLRELVNEIVTLETAIKRSPKRHGVVWGALTAKFKCTSYHRILGADFERAQAYLRTWCARLRSATSAPANDPDWRNSRYRYIYAVLKEIGRQDELPELMAARYSGRQLKELSKLELETVYRIVADWKKQARQKGAV
ncbi:MAG TPA: hypothetical protein VJ603_00790 [Paucimonas sp.]|nr:hypothetical protein [Paucimonas sp.]